MDGSPRRVSDFARGEKARVLWSPGNLLSVFVRIPGSGPELHQMTPGSGGALQRVFSAPSSTNVVGVARDGHSIYIAAGEGEKPLLERWSLVTGNREVVGAIRAAYVKESSDGAWLYYSRRQASEGVFRNARSGGNETRVIEKVSRRDLFVVRGDWIYFVAPEPQLGAYARRMSDEHTRLLFPLEKVPGWGMDVSPDGKEILLSLIEFDDADIYLAEKLP